MKCITLLLDGAGDRSYEALENMTPLQYANLPNLDKIAKDSQCGIMTPYQIGVPLGTDQAHMILFGYQLKEYPTRTIIDLIGEGKSVDPEALYLRCSFSTVIRDEGFKIQKRFTPDLSDDEIQEFKKVLDCEIDGYQFELLHSYDSHGFIKINGSISDEVSDSDPFQKSYVMAVEAFDTNSEVARMTADVINKYIKHTYDVLNNHPINNKREKSGLFKSNFVLTKWAGRYKELESFKIRNGMSGVIIGKSKLLEGLAKIIGMDYIPYESLIEGVDQALSCDYDYVHLHTKGPDEASHKKDPLLKVRTLEEIDRAIEKLLLHKELLIVTSDHSTPCAGQMIHSGESVAFMASGSLIRRDDIKAFDEISCSKGSIFLKGNDLMNYIINATDRAALFHLKQGKTKRHHISETNYRKLL